MRQLLLSALIVFFVFGNSFIVDEFNRKWEIKTNYSEIKKEKFRYGIVLGGIMNGYIFKTGQLIFNRSVDRLMQAIVLYEQGVIDKIVYSGGSGSIIEKDMKEAKFVREYLLSLGIPDSNLIIDQESRNTYENAVYVKSLIGADHNRRDLLITSGTHMRRSVAIFEKQGFSVVPYSADLRSGKRKYDPEHLLIPSLKAFEEWNALIHEWVGIVAYRLNGYM